MRLAPIPYARLCTAELIACYNALAKTRGRERLTDWRKSRVALVEKLAILRTLPETKKVKPTKLAGLTGRDLRTRSKLRASPVRDASVKALCRVHRYIIEGGKRRSIGLSYEVCVAMVRKAVPGTKVSVSDMRWTVGRIRKGIAGYEGVLPYHRPRKKGN